MRRPSSMAACACLGALRRSALSGERVGHQDRGDAPVGDRALRVGLQHVPEGLLALGVPERVQHRDCASERRLHLGIAARRERHVAQLAGLRRGWPVPAAVEHRRQGDKKGTNEDQLHGAPRFLRTSGGRGQCSRKSHRSIVDHALTVDADAADVRPERSAPDASEPDRCVKAHVLTSAQSTEQRAATRAIAGSMRGRDIARRIRYKAGRTNRSRHSQRVSRRLCLRCR